MNRDMLAILERTLKQGPATVLTNGMLLRKEVCRHLQVLFDAGERACRRTKDGQR